MLVGYARTSTADQKAGLEAQVAELRAAVCEELFVEQVSSNSTTGGTKEGPQIHSKRRHPRRLET